MYNLYKKKIILQVLKFGYNVPVELMTTVKEMASGTTPGEESSSSSILCDPTPRSEMMIGREPNIR